MSEHTYKFHKAGKVVDPVPNTVIEICMPIENMEADIGKGAGWERQWREFYGKEGRKLAKLLRESLPGGTYNALLVDMMDRTRSILQVPFGEPGTTTVSYPTPNGGHLQLNRQELLRGLAAVEEAEDISYAMRLQEVFNVLASIIEDIKLRAGPDPGGDVIGSGVLSAAEELCNQLRDEGMARTCFACDYVAPEDEQI